MRKTSSNLIEQKESARIDKLRLTMHLSWLLSFSYSCLDLHVALLISMPIGGANIGPMIGSNMSRNLGGAASGPER